MKPLKVLLVDDEEELVTTLVERLQIRNIEATAATCSHDALDMVKKQHFDVVVADLKMPGMSGLQLIDYVKEHDPGMHIILITGHGSASDAPEDEVPDGVNDILLKPFNIENLVDAINRVMDSDEDEP